MASPFWGSRDFFRHRAQIEIAKAVDASPLALRIHHLREAERWFRQAERDEG